MPVRMNRVGLTSNSQPVVTPVDQTGADGGAANMPTELKVMLINVERLNYFVAWTEQVMFVHA